MVFVLVCTVLVHYLLTPTELPDPKLGLLIRTIAGCALLVIVGPFAHPKASDVGFMFLAFVAVAAWFALVNQARFLGAMYQFTIFLLIAFGLALSSQRSKTQTRSSTVERMLSGIIVCWTGALLFQLGYYLATGESLDIHAMLHPGSESRLFEAMSFIRLTGTHLEPGTYSHWLYGVILLRAFVSGKLFDLLSILGVASIYVSLSAWGALSATIYFACLLLRHLQGRVDRRGIAITGTLVVVAALGAYHFNKEIEEFLTYLTIRSELTDTSGIAKLAAYDGFLRVLDRIVLIGLPIDYDFCEGCLAPQDAGLFVNLAVRTGLVFAAAAYLIVFHGAYRTCGWPGLIATLPLVFAKYFYFEPLFWMIVGVSLLHRPRLRSNKRATVFDRDTQRGPGQSHQ
jgi:hypothetical protein